MEDSERILRLEYGLKRLSADVEHLYKDPLVGGDFIKRALATIGYQALGCALVLLSILSSKVFFGLFYILFSALG